MGAETYPARANTPRNTSARRKDPRALMGAETLPFSVLRLQFSQVEKTPEPSRALKR